MGLSITSGCITTFFSGGVLFFGNITFFRKFAFVICLTSLMAYIMAMIVFGAIMHIMGPEKNFCTITCRKKVDEDPKPDEASDQKEFMNLEIN